MRSRTWELRNTIIYTSVRAYGRGMSHIVCTRGRYTEPFLGLGVRQTLCGLDASRRIRGLPPSRVNCSDCRAIAETFGRIAA